MKVRVSLVCSLSVIVATLLAAAPSDPAGLVVHEWGTFLAMNGSDGVSLDGMYHEEHALPAFVHARRTDQLRLPMSLLKTETPVIYFYTQQHRRVQVEVAFPTGLWTQWYPQAAMVAPGLVQAESPPRARNGRIAWDVDLRPAAWSKNRLPFVDADALWNHSRAVNSAFVIDASDSRPHDEREWERFIFYRGLGEAPLPIEVRAAGGRVRATTSEPDGLKHLFILRVAGGRAAYTYIPAIDRSRGLDVPVPSLTAAAPLDTFVRRISADVAARLMASGLYESEARATVNTWASSYFKTDGIRVLVVLPQSWTDRFIPMRITPVPTELVRVMVGRIELLDPDRERRAEAAIRDLASPDAAVRDGAFEALRAEGRYVEPIVRRALRTTTDERVRTLSRRLLLTDFVTDLRSALTDPATGERVSTDPVYIQAQLSSLLREVGLTAEARMEGTAALTKLEARRQPTMGDHLSRHMFRALARAHEGAGNDSEALHWYGEFVRFASQSAAGVKQCVGCHVTLGPRDLSFFRDWYAGRKFGEYAVRTGEAPRLIGSHQNILSAHPNAVSSRLSLAYLYEATDQINKAEEVWARLIPDPDP